MSAIANYLLLTLCATITLDIDAVTMISSRRAQECCKEKIESSGCKII